MSLSQSMFNRLWHGGAAMAMLASASFLMNGPLTVAQEAVQEVEELVAPPSTPAPERAADTLPQPAATLDTPAAPEDADAQPIQDANVQPAEAVAVEPAKDEPQPQVQAAPLIQGTPVVSESIPQPMYVDRFAPTSQTFPEHDNWTVTIIPGPSNRPQDLIINGMSYQQVYESIPYRRSEYLANPAYRHETTMEVLFGQMRPTTVVKQQNPQVIENPRPELNRPYLMTPSDFYSYPWQYGLFPGGFPMVPGLVAPRLTY